MNNVAGQKAGSKRILSVDILRGLTVFIMLLVEFMPDPERAPEFLVHAPWNGITLADVVFPAFMLIMGASVYFALSRNQFQPTKTVLLRIFVRAATLYLASLAIYYIGDALGYYNQAKGTDFWPRVLESFSHFETLRIGGVLPRLAVTYLAVSLLALFINHRFMPWLAGGVLVIYGALLQFGSGFSQDGNNILYIIDRSVLGTGHMYFDEFSYVDPEGFTSTFGALATVLLGFILGQALRSNAELTQKFQKLLIFGGSLIAIGGILALVEPLNKKVWSPSFTLVTAGITVLALALIFWVADLKGHTKLAWIPNVFGLHALTAYVLSDLIGEILNNIDVRDKASYNSVFHYFYERDFQPTFSDLTANCIYAAMFTAAIWALSWGISKLRQVWSVGQRPARET